MRSRLRIKFVINGNSFHYGRLIASYSPMDFADQTELAPTYPVVMLSQRPHVYIDPQTSQGGEMVLPFFWHKNWLSIPDSDWRSMGTLNLRTINLLKHANGGTDHATVTIFAWAEDFVLPSVPTTIVSQAGSRKRSTRDTHDEYGDGIISKPASVVQKVASLLENVPVIGPFAKATSMAAGATSTIASMFGFSRPAIISNVQLYKPLYSGNLANSDAHEAINKLTIDSKQELCVDSRTVGLAGADELDIVYIAGKESYLTSFMWNTSTAVDSRLWNSRVNPVLFQRDEQGTLAMTPMCYASQPFINWSGSINFRFQVVASQYHRGRIRIVYDPQVYIGTAYNQAFTRVIDLAEERDFEIEVAWAQNAAYREVLHASTASTQFGDTPIASPDLVYSNGVLSVFVVNTLVTPNNQINNNISINVFVSAGKDIEFANPTERNLKNLTYFANTPVVSQAGPDVESETSETDANIPSGANSVLSVGKCMSHPQKNLVFYGEHYTSFRTLMRRYWLHSGKSRYFSSSEQLSSWHVQYNNFPNFRGYDPTGIDTAADARRYNYSNMTLMNYLVPSFVGWRGALRYKYVLEGSVGQENATLSVQRHTLAPGYSDDVNVFSSTAISGSDTAKRIIQYFSSGYSGAYITPSNNQPTAEVELPFYSPYRFAFARHLENNSGSTLDGTIDMNHSVEISVRNTDNFVTYRRYVAPGEDFMPFFWLNVPLFHVYADPDGEPLQAPTS